MSDKVSVLGLHKGDIAKKRYILDKLVDAGAFGELWFGHVVKTPEQKVAPKFENIYVDKKQLGIEYGHYKEIIEKYKNDHNGEEPEGIPKLYNFGSCDDKPAHCLIMECLGKPLEGLFNQCERKFSKKTILQIAIQLIKRIELVHNAGVIHRDIKSENFLIGLKPKHKIIYIIDFGLSKSYYDEEATLKTKQKVHIPQSKTKEMTLGTLRYMSVNSHQGKTLSRRDDLISIGYVLIYFAKGVLPWQGLGGEPPEKEKLIERKKASVPVKELCSGLLPCFEKYMNYVLTGIEFAETPDYEFCRKVFEYQFRKSGIERDEVYDWETI